MKGIYKFTNKINNKSYIGQSVNLESRYASHKRNYINSNLSCYNNKFYSAIRKYGFENFTYEILKESENFTVEQLNEMEIYYIKKYNSYYQGYNMNPGGNNTGTNYFIPENIIIQIKQDLQNEVNLSLTDIAKKYHISSISIISAINNGKSYNFIGEYYYPIRSKEEMKYTQQGGNNGRSIFSDKEVMFIREQFQYKTLKEIYEEYKEKISYSALKKIIYGVHYTHLPIYKKRNKSWFLHGTCIDYPREEEQKNQ